MGCYSPAAERQSFQGFAAGGTAPGREGKPPPNDTESGRCCVARVEPVREGLVNRRRFLTAAGASILAGSLASSLPAWAAPLAVDPLLAPWTGPHGGVPPFDKVQVERFPPAFEAAMAEFRAEVRRIADGPQEATFANTLAALEGAGRAYTRVTTLFDVYTSNLNTAAVQKVDREWKPRFAAFNDEITQDVALFRRIEAVFEGRKKGGLTPEQQRLALLYHRKFVREGARLDRAQKEQLSGFNQRLASLFTRFSQNVLGDEESYRLVLETEDDLKGLPRWLRDAAAATATEKGLRGRWVIANTRSAMEPFLTYSERRDLREKGWRMWTRRGDNGGERDNNAIITEIVQLRARRAKLLGYPTFAHWQLENAMARTPERAMQLMMQVWPAAVARVKQEVADMQAVADREGAHLTIEPWDYRFYAEKVRRAKYDLDENLIKPYLQLDKLREALFWVSGQLFGFRFEEIRGLPAIHPDVRTWRVSGADGKRVGLWYWDPYARSAKKSGAWMSEYRSQEDFEGFVTPIVSNNSNFVKGAAGAPVLISWDDAETLFHEFGHAVHGLLSRVHYPFLAGTSVARDFVEFPSQLFENWLSTPEVLNRFALHWQTGKPMPRELVEKIHRAATFNQGFATTEYLASAILDMKLHLLGDVAVDPREFERRTLRELGMPREMVMRHRLPQFGHVFSGDDYAAGYYSYLWSEVLDHDAYQAFVEAGSPYDAKVARRLREEVLQVGNTIEPDQAYRNFRGREASIVPLLRHRGFPVSSR